MSAQPSYTPTDCTCELRDCECAGTHEETYSLDGKERMVFQGRVMVAAFRLCAFCDEEFELDGQPTDDDRRYCDKGCWYAEGGKL